MEDVETDFGQLDIRASPLDGSIEDGEVRVSSIELEVEVPEEVDLSQEVDFPSPEFFEVLAEAIMPGDLFFPETLDGRSWDEPRYVETGTKRWRVLQYIVSNGPTTTGRMKQFFEDRLDVRNVVHKLKRDNLAKAIGKDGNAHVLVPTHAGYKEVYTIHGMNCTKYDGSKDETEPGLAQFFDNGDNDDETSDSE